VCSLVPSVVVTNDSKDNQFDGMVVVTDSLEHLPTSLRSLHSTLDNYFKVPPPVLLLLSTL